MEVTPRQLRYLIAVIDDGHFGRAAQRLFIASPALSQQIRKLESMVGFELLDRKEHPIRPTPQASEFVAAARTVVTQLDELTAISRSSERRRGNQFKIGFALTFAGPLTQPILRAFEESFPTVQVELHELSFSDQLRAVIDGTVDVSFARGPVQPTTGIHLSAVLCEPRVLAVSVNHPLAGHASIGINEIADMPQIAPAESMGDEAWRRWWAVDPRPDGSRPRYAFSIHTAAEFLEGVASGRAVAITTLGFGNQYARSDVVYVPITDIPESELMLCSRQHDPSPFVDRLREVVSATR